MPTDLGPSRVHTQARIRFLVDRGQQNSTSRVYDLIRAGIRTGQLKRDVQLSEELLVRGLTTSRAAVRGALQLLASEGLVERRPRSGTRVRREIEQLPGDVVLSFTQVYGADRVHVRQLDHRVVPPSALVRDMLELAPGVDVRVVEWSIDLDGEPYGLRTSYTSAETALPHEPEKIDNVQRAFRDCFGVALGRSETVVESISASAELAAKLDIREGTPVLAVELRQVDVEGQPRGMTYTQYRGDRLALSYTVVEPQA